MDSQAWSAYLANMEATRRLPEGVIQNARAIVDIAMRAWGVPVPSAVPTPEDRLQVVWDRDEHHLEVEVGGETFEWFYRNRETELLEGAGDCVHPFGKIWAHFGRFAVEGTKQAVLLEADLMESERLADLEYAIVSAARRYIAMPEGEDLVGEAFDQLRHAVGAYEAFVAEHGIEVKDERSGRSDRPPQAG